jgi:rhamnosyltransferase subunit B
MTASIAQDLAPDVLPPPARRLKVLVTTFGSYGDLHPYVAAAAALRERGHDVVLITNAHFEPLAREAGVPIVPCGSCAEYEEMIASAGKGLPTLIDLVVGPNVSRVYRAIEQLYEPGRTVVLGSGWSFGARVAEEKLGVATATMLISPQTLMSAIDPGEMPRFFPLPLRRWLLRYVERKILDPALAPGVNAARAAVGLGPINHIQSRWLFAPRRVICMWPDWFAHPCADWPPQARTTGFVMYDGARGGELPPALREFLAAGPAPIAFVTSTGMRDVGNFFVESARACAMMGARGVLLSKAAHVTASLPNGVMHVDYAPFAKLLPHCRAVVHQGTIGTSAAATCAGLPQIAVPYGIDQPDNATRLSRLGICKVISPRRYRGERVAKHLTRMMADERVAHQCGQLADRIRSARPLDEICRLTEALAADAYGWTSGMHVAGR